MLTGRRQTSWLFYKHAQGGELGTIEQILGLVAVKAVAWSRCLWIKISRALTTWPFCGVVKGFSLTRDGTEIICVMCDLAQIRRVMRDWAQQRDAWFTIFTTCDFRLKFPWWSISFETRSRHQHFVLFSRSSTSDFLRSNDNRILVDVVNMLLYFSIDQRDLW